MTVEFPNDNPDLWSNRAPLAALAILLAEAEVAEDEKEAERSDPNELVDFPVVTAVVEEAVPVATVAAAPEKEAERSDPNELHDFPVVTAVVEEAVPVAERSDPNELVDSSPLAAAPEEDDGPEVEVIEFDEADFAVIENESIPPPPKPDLFQVFARTLVEVALAAGAPGRVVEMLPGMLGIARLDASVLDAPALEALVAQGMLARSESGAITRSEMFVSAAQAWRSTILGEEADFSACTSTLDEWSATLVATLANMPQQRETFRRDLRSRGVAAFGLLVEAA